MVRSAEPVRTWGEWSVSGCEGLRRGVEGGAYVLTGAGGEGDAVDGAWLGGGLVIL